MLILLLLVWMGSLTLCSTFVNITACITEDKKYNILCESSSQKLRREIPNKVTLNELGFGDSKVVEKSNQDLSKYQLGPVVPSLEMYAVNPDEVLRVAVHRAKVLNPVNFTIVANEHGYFNPSFVMWGDRILMIWAMASDHAGNALDPNTPNKGAIRFCWLEKYSWHKCSTETLKGIGPDFLWSPTENGIKIYEDARLLALTNGSLLMTYVAVDHNAGILYRKVIFTYNEKTSKLEWDQRVIMNSEKNWITFEHDKKVYYIRGVNPLHISEFVVTDGVETLTNVVELAKTQVPFDSRYMEHSFRGSTPAILVKGVYLTFFHTRALVQQGSRRCTYFMGAMTLCPHYPYHIHSMSHYPIVEPGWYDGPWLFNTCDYIVYPAGIILSPDNSSVYISSGYQDRDMHILKFNVEELFDSLVEVNKCNS